ncbi:hypothetical protein [Streptomyces sp. DSM 40750]|uniref:hypothetical protein n=1 Tax=Streptomyces sp. DSM 40750 TaxID=2801030 RepID=UPI00214AE006|nr:hypothetical protein [Streptomyces sp. DSM 40750]UUU25839.1 hypothetical protein JIX55_39455 [Streptomyces sp. DSM 40750]
MSTIATIAAGSSGLTDMQQKLIIGLASAFVGVFGTLLVHFLKVRQEPRKRISWDSDTKPGLDNIDPELRDELRISYNGTRVYNLFSARYRLANSGNTVIKDQRVRFSIPDGVQLLNLIPAPDPEPELGVERSPESSDSEIIYTIGQLERGEEVGFSLVLDGENARQWKVKTSNKEGDVEVDQRGSQRNAEDRAHVVPFLASLFFLFAVPSVISGLTFDSALGDALASLARIALLLFSLLHLFPALRLIRDTWFSGRQARVGYDIAGDHIDFNGSTFHGPVTGKQDVRNREEEPSVQ